MNKLKKNESPLVSIIVPVYNLENQIENLIESILNQTYRKWELIVINDNSIDKSRTIIEKYVARDSRILLINNPKNLGLSGSRNKGLKFSKGDYVQFIDGDDSLTPNALDSEVKKLIQSEADILHFNYNIVAPERPLTSSEKRLEKESIKEAAYVGQEQLKLLFSGGISHFAWSFIVKRELFQNNMNLFPEGRLFEDFATIYKWLYSAEKLYVLNQKIYNYIQRDSSIMHRPELKHAADINTTVEELDIFSSNNIPELKKYVIQYEMPRLLNAYGISLKSDKVSINLTNNIRIKVLKKVFKVGIGQLGFRDRVKIMLIFTNTLKYLYRFKGK